MKRRGFFRALLGVPALAGLKLPVVEAKPEPIYIAESYGASNGNFSNTTTFDTATANCLTVRFYITNSGGVIK